MRRVLFLILWVAASVSAAEVTVTGHGKSMEAALQQAKLIALEASAGTFISGKTMLENGVLHDKTEQFNGGLIKKYQVIGVEDQDGWVAVTILADVAEGKNNTVLNSQGGTITNSMRSGLQEANELYDRSRKIVEALDDPGQAFAVRIRHIRLTPRGDKTEVGIAWEVVLSPKWYDDMKLMAKTAGKEMDIGSPWKDALWGVAAVTAAANPVWAMRVFSVAEGINQPDVAQAGFSLCFTNEMGWDVTECFAMQHPLKNVTRPIKVRFSAALGEQRARLGEQTIRTQPALLYDAASGQRVYFIQSAKERRFKMPTAVLAKNGCIIHNTSLLLDNSVASQMRLIDIEML